MDQRESEVRNHIDGMVKCCPKSCHHPAMTESRETRLTQAKKRDIMVLGYSGKSLVTKLGLKPYSSLYTFDAPSEYLDWLEPLPEGVKHVTILEPGLEFIHGFFRERIVFEEQLSTFKSHLEKKGMIWISWLKKSAKIPTDIIEDAIREVALPMGLVDVKVCAVSEIWSGLKLVIPVSKR